MACTAKAFEYFKISMSSKDKKNSLNLLDSDSESVSSRDNGEDARKTRSTKLSINKKFAAAASVSPWPYDSSTSTVLTSGSA